MILVNITGTGSKNNPIRPDTDLIYTSWEDLGNGTCKLHLSDEQMEALTITAAQGKTQLLQMGILDQVEQEVVNSNNVALQLFWNNSPTWRISSQAINGLAQQMGVNLEQFFKDAKQIEV